MSRKPPLPVCKAFLVCRQVITDPNTHEMVLIGMAKAHTHHVFPSAVQAGFFARLTSAHGDYLFEVQLQNEQGEVLWHEGPPTSWPLHDALELYDVSLNLCPIFLGPGDYDFVLTANGEEVARHRFPVRLAPQPVGR